MLSYERKDKNVMNMTPLMFDQNSSSPGKNGRHSVDEIFICIFLNE